MLEEDLNGLHVAFEGPRSHCLLLPSLRHWALFFPHAMALVQPSDTVRT